MLQAHPQIQPTETLSVSTQMEDPLRFAWENFATFMISGDRQPLPEGVCADTGRDDLPVYEMSSGPCCGTGVAFRQTYLTTEMMELAKTITDEKKKKKVVKPNRMGCVNPNEAVFITPGHTQLMSIYDFAPDRLAAAGNRLLERVDPSGVGGSSADALIGQLLWAPPEDPWMYVRLGKASVNLKRLRVNPGAPAGEDGPTLVHFCGADAQCFSVNGPLVRRVARQLVEHEVSMGDTMRMVDLRNAMLSRRISAEALDAEKQALRKRYPALAITNDLLFGLPGDKDNVRGLMAVLLFLRRSTEATEAAPETDAADA